jgi:hypothetical protein
MLANVVNNPTKSAAPRNTMRFGLKHWLLGVGILGATFGLLTRLLLKEPETFIPLLQLKSMVGPFLFAVGTIIWIGLFRAPRSRKLVIWGAALLVLPPLSSITLRAILPLGNPLGLLTTQRLISSRLPHQVDQPWVWRELERRLTAGSLAMTDVDAAFVELTSYMKQKQQGWNQPLSWQRDFIQQALQQNMVSDSVFLDLCDAFFGTEPKVTIINPPAVEGTAQFNLQIEYGSPWSDHSGLAITPVWDCTRLTLNGKPIKLRRFDKHFGRQATVLAEAPFQAGENILEVEAECAFIDDGLLAGADLDKLTAAQWPRTRKGWTANVVVPIQVAPTAKPDAPDESAP